ncbi:LysR family transcriptional regulator [Vibrio sp. vnigr-6D03]|uniref:LysR family transcriptional regulator n=1 Tax=Vibrio sp. vnigr-6D03 TaxID=2058088 RepID=UPI000C346A87|nr:LysR family transcriptional regulator [Vibrio sp. vnigr-6D03]PKF81422.1 LysR family transcriptional regulator [Vibrio sp. vnigr-6D03]
MELRTLRYFLKVYEVGSVSGAAKYCFVSQPSITSAIKNLESVLNTTLFVRHARGVAPTPAAQQLYPEAKRMIDSEKNILQTFRDQPVTVPLRLGIMRSLGAKRMSLLLQHLSQDIEHLELTLVDADEPCDARVLVGSSRVSDDQFVPIWEDTYQLALPHHWAEAQKGSLDFEDLDGMPFIHREPCIALDSLKDSLLQRGIQFNARANIRTIDYAWPLVQAGVGAALLPNWAEITGSECIALRSIKGFDCSLSVGMAVNISQRSIPLMNQVIASCRRFTDTI